VSGLSHVAAVKIITVDTRFQFHISECSGTLRLQVTRQSEKYATLST